MLNATSVRRLAETYMVGLRPNLGRKKKGTPFKRRGRGKHAHLHDNQAIVHATLNFALRKHTYLNILKIFSGEKNLLFSIFLLKA